MEAITGHSVPILSYSTVRGVEKRLQLEDYLPGCPPKPEAVIDAITKHHKKVYQEIYEEDRCVAF